MPSIRRVLAIGFGVASPLVVAPVVGEFFVEWAKQKGAYDYPSERVAAAMTWLLSVADLPGFKLIAGLVLGLAIGMWLDQLLRKREAGPVAQHSDARDREKHVAQDCIALSEEILRERLRWEQSNPDVPRGPDPGNLGDVAWAQFLRGNKITATMAAQFSTRAYASLSALDSIGVRIPAFSKNPGLPLEMTPLHRVIGFHLSDVARFLGVIGRRLSDDGLDEAKHAAERWEVIGSPLEPQIQKPADRNPT